MENSVNGARYSAALQENARPDADTVLNKLGSTLNGLGGDEADAINRGNIMKKRSRCDVCLQRKKSIDEAMEWIKTIKKANKLPERGPSRDKAPGNGCNISRF
ncbi:MAG: hypothetical protein HQL30_09945 [Candidatus Omnitrophica bacterium]|nr:hypothetical protein [Candidatus Omnitrophota bacterium]